MAYRLLTVGAISVLAIFIYSARQTIFSTKTSGATRSSFRPSSPSIHSLLSPFPTQADPQAEQTLSAFLGHSPSLCQVKDVCYNHSNGRYLLPPHVPINSLRGCMKLPGKLSHYNETDPIIQSALANKSRIHALGVFLHNLHMAHFTEYLLKYVSRSFYHLQNSPPDLPLSILITTRIAKRFSSWIASFLSHFLTAVPFQSSLHIHMLPKPPNQISCFSSIISAAQPNMSHLQHIVRSKWPARKPPPFNIVVISRPSKDKGPAWRRTNRSLSPALLRDLPHYVRYYSQKHKLKTSYTHISGLGSLKPVEQFRLFHSADLLIIAHGAELSNIMFMRPGSAVVELVPFRLRGKFYHFAYSGLNLRWRQLLAEPDANTFISCIIREKGFEHIKGVYLDQATGDPIPDYERNKIWAGLTIEECSCARMQQIGVSAAKVAKAGFEMLVDMKSE